MKQLDLEALPVFDRQLEMAAGGPRREGGADLVVDAENRRLHVPGARPDHAFRRGGDPAHDERHPGLEDAGFLPRNLGNLAAKVRGVLAFDARDAG